MKASCTGCPYLADCGGMLRMGYGFAGGVGIGAYLFCDKCSVVTDKWPDQEMQ